MEHPAEEQTRTGIRVLSTLAVARAIPELAARYERLTGTVVAVDLAPTNALVDRITSGESADVAILTAAAIDRLLEAGVLVAGSRRDLARSFVGIAVKAGAPKPDIGSTAALTATLLAAGSIAYSRIGASGVFFADLIRRLGIADAVAAKARIIPSGFTAELVARGEAELAVQQVSELMAVAGVEVVGRLPPEVDAGTTFSAGVFAASERREAAARFIEVLSSGESAAILRASGLEPVPQV